MAQVNARRKAEGGMGTHLQCAITICPLDGSPSRFAYSSTPCLKRLNHRFFQFLMRWPRFTRKPEHTIGTAAPCAGACITIAAALVLADRGSKHTWLGIQRRKRRARLRMNFDEVRGGEAFDIRMSSSGGRVPKPRYCRHCCLLLLL
jgi:hypothetical protein